MHLNHGKEAVPGSQSYDLLVAWGAKPPKSKFRLYWLTGEVCLEWVGLFKPGIRISGNRCGHLKKYT